MDSGHRSLTRQRLSVMVFAIGLSLACDVSTLCPSAIAAPTDAEAAPQQATGEAKPQADEASPAAVIQVTGEVGNPGSLQIAAGKQLTVSGAIMKAGGLGPWGNGRMVKLIRQKNGTTETIIVNYYEIIKTGDVKSDLVVMNGDRIFVPKKTIGF